MIKESELRVGNWVMITTPFCLDYSVMHDIYIENDWDELKPIPLTEEWLIKAGAIKRTFTAEFIGDYDSFAIGNYELSNIYNNVWGIIGIDMSPLLYVHQLQNLIFALTNTELTINND